MIQINRFTFRGPFVNLNEIKNRPGIFILHTDKEARKVIAIKETTLLLTAVTEELQAKELSLGNDCFLSVYNTFCTLSSDRQKMIEEIENSLSK